MTVALLKAVTFDAVHDGSWKDATQLGAQCIMLSNIRYPDSPQTLCCRRYLRELAGGATTFCMLPFSRDAPKAVACRSKHIGQTVEQAWLPPGSALQQQQQPSGKRAPHRVDMLIHSFTRVGTLLILRDLRLQQHLQQIQRLSKHYPTRACCLEKRTYVLQLPARCMRQQFGAQAAHAASFTLVSASACGRLSIFSQ